MRIWVSSLSMVHGVAAETGPERVVSLLAKADAFPSIEGYADDRHHKVQVDDVREEIEGYVAPNGDHVRGLIAFLKDWRREKPLLIHCWAGVSRSTAAAYIAACLHNPEADEFAIAGEIGRASPTAFPNTRIVAIADEILRRRGRMDDAAARLCADRERAVRALAAGVAAPFSIPALYDAQRQEGSNERP